MDKPESAPRRHIILTSHPSAGGKRAPALRWGAATAAERGPIIATTADPSRRNAIGTQIGRASCRERV